MVCTPSVQSSVFLVGFPLPKARQMRENLHKTAKFLHRIQERGHRRKNPHLEREKSTLCITPLIQEHVGLVATTFVVPCALPYTASVKHSTTFVVSCALLYTANVKHSPSIVSHMMPHPCAFRIQDGPVATIQLPHALPYGLHGAWTSEYWGPDPNDPSVPRWCKPSRIREL